MGVARGSHGTPLDESLRRLEEEARARARGEKRVGPEARSPVCEVCGGGGVRWGALCAGCRQRLQAAVRRLSG